MTYFCFSDIHGHKVLFDKITHFLEGRSDEWKCVFLGDACDRKKDGYEIIERLLNDERFIYLKGNHEDLFTKAARALKRLWSEENFDIPLACDAGTAEQIILNYYWMSDDIQLHIFNGGLPTLVDWVRRGAPWEVIRQLDGLHDIAELSNDVYGKLELCHAGHLVDESDNPFWSREHFEEKWPHGLMVHGHTPTIKIKGDIHPISPQMADRIFMYQDNTKLCIDTGCFATNAITLLNLNTMEQYVFRCEAEGDDDDE